MPALPSGLTDDLSKPMRLQAGFADHFPDWAASTRPCAPDAKTKSPELLILPPSPRKTPLPTPDSVPVRSLALVASISLKKYSTTTGDCCWRRRLFPHSSRSRSGPKVRCPAAAAQQRPHPALHALKDHVHWLSTSRGGRGMRRSPEGGGRFCGIDSPPSFQRCKLPARPNGGAIHRRCSHANADMCDVRGKVAVLADGGRWPLRHGADEFGGGFRNSLTPFGALASLASANPHFAPSSPFRTRPRSTPETDRLPPRSASLRSPGRRRRFTVLRQLLACSHCLAPLLPTRPGRLWLPRPRDSGCSLDGVAVRSISPPSAC